MPESESSEIARSTSWTLAGLGFGAIAAAVAEPAGAFAAAAAGVGVGGGIEIWRQVSAFREARSEERLEAFRLELMRPVTEGERDALLQRPFSAEEFAAVIEGVLTDVESHKARYYAKLQRALILEDFDWPMRTHLIRSFRGLTLADFALMEKICAATLSEARMPESTAPEHQVRRLVPPSGPAADPLAHACAENLVHWGYLKHGERDGIPWPTRLSKVFARVAEIPEPRL